MGRKMSAVKQPRTISEKMNCYKRISNDAMSMVVAAARVNNEIIAKTAQKLKVIADSNWDKLSSIIIEETKQVQEGE